jgi:hypothetical protein
MEEKGILGRNAHPENWQHEPLICIVCVLFSCNRPWSLRCTKLVGDMERSLRGMPLFNTARTGSLLPKFLEQMRALESMPVGMVRHLLRPDKIGQVSRENIGERMVKQW